MLTRAFASEVGTLHEASNTTLTNALALLDKDVTHARAAVGVQALRMDLHDALGEALIFKQAWPGLARAPGIEARARDVEVVAHHRDRPGLPVCFDEGEDFAFSSEANRIAFFRMSCST